MFAVVSLVCCVILLLAIHYVALASHHYLYVLIGPNNILLLFSMLSYLGCHSLLLISSWFIFPLQDKVRINATYMLASEEVLIVNNQEEKQMLPSTPRMKNCTSNLHSYGQTRNLQRNNKHKIINTHYHENQF